MMNEALKSRKLWVTLGTIISVLAAEVFGYTIQPEAIVGLAGIVLSYNFGQGWVDKTTAQEAIKAEADFGKQQLIAYVNRLQAELAAIGADAPDISPNGVAEITE